MIHRSLVTATQVLVATALITGTQSGARAQQPAHGRLDSIVVHGASLEQNLVGNSPDRAVSVYLPPSYDKSNRRYPVVYVLHGIMDSPRAWTEPWGPPNQPNTGFATIQDLMDRGIANGTIAEMILVIPDADKSCHYTDSPVKGGWASFIAKDLVQYVDRTYRTVASSDSRALLGHSMGGHGAIKLAMVQPGVFSAVYAMNPSMLGWGGELSRENPQLGELARVSTPQQIAGAGFYAQAIVGVGQCFSPNPAAPLLMDIPFVSPNAEARWTAQMPVYMAPRHAAELKALRGLRFDTAVQDEYTHIPITTRALSAVLDSMHVAHTFEIYEGDHRNRLWGENGRLYTIALPYLSRLIAPDAKLRPPRVLEKVTAREQ
ncbi:MAG TPA: alpha/beta hydrolase [Gemmatimonadaceae bacterium]|nr:alpha/beta hydrolase [Gemmatimonadaceae bacterium]